MSSRFLSSMLALALAGCTPAVSLAIAPADGNVTATGYLTPRSSDGRLLTVVNAWGAADIDHAVLTLTGGGSTLTLTVPGSQLTSPVSFTALKNSRTYTIVGRAYNTPDSSVPIDNYAISSASCTTTFSTSTDTAASIGSIAIQLANRSYSGAGSAGLAIGAGAINNPVGNEVATPGARSYTITTFAGTGTSGSSGDGSPSTAALLGTAYGVTLDAAGNLYIADASNNRVRMVCAAAGTYFGIAMTAGNIYGLAGTGTAGYTGDGAAATSAKLQGPRSVAVDAFGNLYIADTTNHAIRLVCNTTGAYYGSARTAGQIYTVAGTGASGNTGDGSAATGATFNLPGGLATDAFGNLYVADTGNNRIRLVCQTAGTFFGSARSAGNVYALAGTGTASFSGDSAAASGATLSGPGGLALDGSGNLYVADAGNSRVRFVCGTAGTYFGAARTLGTIYTLAGSASAGLAGDGSAATAAQLDTPSNVTLDAIGNFFVADTHNNRIRKVTTAGTISTFAGTNLGYSGDGGAATSAQLSAPNGLAVDGSGRLYLVDQGNFRVRVLQ